MSDYLPKRESDLKTFALNFAALAKASPVSYALVAADAAVIEAVAKEYAEKLDRAVNPPADHDCQGGGALARVALCRPLDPGKPGQARGR